MGSTSIGARAAPVFHATTGQKESGKVKSLIPNSLLMGVAAAVIEVELSPTISVLHVALV
jgi:hypothetical protein